MGAAPMRRALIATLFLSGSGCTMPRRGTPVFVDARAGSFWSGKGVLTEVSADQQRCHVAVRDRALVLRKIWLPCSRIHPRL